ncbi:MAG: enoyl-CoA hydratase-related protein, partial [Pseudomonadota bacterium]
MKDLPFDVRDGVAVITLENPPVNGLSHALRSGIVAGLDRANADPEIRAVVLIGTGKGFSGGADITEFGKPSAMAAPNLRTVIDIIEANGKPVVAAVHGLALGGGLELALGCHYRVASPDASIGLPEVKLGLLPGAGGTQRFPRAVGLETALNMIVSGEPVKSQYLKGLFDEIIEGDLVDGAVAYANSIADARPLPQLRTKRVQHPNPEGFLHVAAMTVQAVAKGYPAPMKCVEAVKAAVSEKFDRGMQVELDAFAQLLQSSESASLRHIFFSERATAHIPDVPRDTPTRPIEKAAVLGAGTMGSGIAMCFAAAGIPVALYEREQAPLERGMGAIQGYFASRAKKGKMTPEAAEQKASLVTPTLELSDIGDADLV